MRRLIALFVVLFVAATSIVDGGSNHVKLLNETVRPFQWVDMDLRSDTFGELETHCSAFSVNPENHGWMTAAHCILEDDGETFTAPAFYIDGHPAVVVDFHRELDIAILRTPDYRMAKGLKLARRAPAQGDRLEVLGYAWGLTKPLYFQGIVAQVDMPVWGFFGSYVNMTAIGGMSGSAVVDAEGRVVGVVHVRVGGNQSADPILGYMSFKHLKEFDRGWVFSR